MPARLRLGLNVEARSMIKAHGISLREYLDLCGHGSSWRGDECGCEDDRCRGHHHAELEPCGCLPVRLADLLKQRSATDRHGIAPGLDEA